MLKSIMLIERELRKKTPSIDEIKCLFSDLTDEIYPYLSLSEQARLSRDDARRRDARRKAIEGKMRYPIETVMRRP